jgi:C1A family cysteine protease
MKIILPMLLLILIGSIFVNKSKAEDKSQLMTKQEVIDLVSRGYHEEKSVSKYEQRIKYLMPLKGLRKNSTNEIGRRVSIENLPEDVDLRNFASSVKSQGSEGTCTAFGITAAQESSHCALNGSCNLDLSERQRWNMYKQYRVEPAIASIKNPIGLEKDCPYSKKECPVKVPESSIYKITKMVDLTTKEEVLEALARGKHVYFWSQVPQQMADCARTITSSKMVDGGHAYLVAGYFSKDDPVLILKNSWGKDCGDNGWQYLQFSDFDKEGYWGASSVESSKILTK